MKKALTILLLLAMALSGMSVSGETGAEGTAEEQARIEYDYDHVTVGNTTPFDGSFFTTLWGSVTSDLDVQRLIHGYNLVEWRSTEGVFAVDPSVVSGIIVTQNGAGDRTYTLSLYGDLQYSDGSAITAWDYAFTWLLRIAPETAAIGGNVQPLNYLVGYDAYARGEARELAGIRVLNDSTIAITVDHEYLPFFYELALLDCNPYPIGEIAPGCAVRDDGNGIYIANADETVTEPVFTAELLRETILDPEKGYQRHPQVVSGPYRLTEYDGTKAEFELNEYYKGNSEGIKPTIGRITYETVSNAGMMEEFSSGRVTLLNKCFNGEAVTAGTRLLAENPDQFAMSAYMRNGMSFLAFCCEQETVKSEKVRQAIAMCMDKDAFVTDTVGNANGLRTDGYYGMGQWMVGMVRGTIPYPVEEPAPDAGDAAQEAYEAELAEWEKVNLDEVAVYSLDTEAAGKLLESEGWTLNRAGEAYSAETDDVRCKEVNGEIVPLELKVLCPTESMIAEELEKAFGGNLKEAGALLTVEEQPMTELMKSYYRQQERNCDMIYLASNFAVVFDPSITFRPDEGGTVNESNPTGIGDAELYQAAVAMRQTEPGDLLNYCRKWVEFQKRFQELEPMIPLYSGVYFDFYPRELQNYEVTASVSWADAIIRAYMSDVPEEEEPTEEPLEEEAPEGDTEDEMVEILD